MYLLSDLDRDLQQLQSQGAFVFDAGYTLLGRPIPCVFKGSMSGAQTLIQACIHAREWVTTPLVIKMMKEYNGSDGVWCFPMVNIDGALLCQQGLQSVSDPSLRQFLLQVNNQSQDFSLWKANARAVDLNVNFNACWGTGEQNITYPAPSNYIGQYPVSESETKTLVDTTNRIMPSVTLSYHARGEVIYKGFGCVDNYVEIASQISESTGYALENSFDSAGGYKDWFVATTTKLGLTIEVGNDNIPYNQLSNQLEEIYLQNKNVLTIATNGAKIIN